MSSALVENVQVVLADRIRKGLRADRSDAGSAA
jgi:hypothetical protein